MGAAHHRPERELLKGIRTARLPRASRLFKEFLPVSLVSWPTAALCRTGQATVFQGEMERRRAALRQSGFAEFGGKKRNKLQLEHQVRGQRHGSASAAFPRQRAPLFGPDRMIALKTRGKLFQQSDRELQVIPLGHLSLDP